MDATFECSSLPEFIDPVSVNDNCDAAVDLTLTETIIPGLCAQSYFIERLWTAVDDCGNSATASQTVLIEDTTNPLLTSVPSDITITCGEAPPTAASPIATDNCDTNVSITFNETSTNNNPTCADDHEITRTWTATDACGNSSVAQQIITIEGDSALPILDNVPTDITIICGAVPPSAATMTATDNCDTNVSIAFNETSTNNNPTCADDYEITRTWTATLSLIHI